MRSSNAFENRMNLNARLIWLLLLSFLIAPAARTADTPALAPAPAVKRIGLGEFEKLRADTNTVVLDVRSPAEFEKGRIPGAVNIDINSSGFSEKMAALDRNKTYLVNCAVGMRSAKACQKMGTMGFKALYDFAPGFDGWKKAGQPVEK